jgi:chromosome segregation ATPase
MSGSKPNPGASTPPSISAPLSPAPAAQPPQDGGAPAAQPPQDGGAHASPGSPVAPPSLSPDFDRVFPDHQHRPDANARKKRRAQTAFFQPAVGPVAPAEVNEAQSLPTTPSTNDDWRGTVRTLDRVGRTLKSMVISPASRPERPISHLASAEPGTDIPTPEKPSPPLVDNGDESDSDSLPSKKHIVPIKEISRSYFGTSMRRGFSPRKQNNDVTVESDDDDFDFMGQYNATMLENEELRAQNNNLSHILNMKIDEISEQLQEQLDDLKEKLRKSELKKDEAESLAEAQRLDLEILNSNLAQLQEQFNSTNNEKRKALEKVEQLKPLEEELRRTSTALGTIRQQNTRLQTNISDLEERLAASRQENEQNDSFFNDKIQLEEISKTLASKLVAFARENEELKEQLLAAAKNDKNLFNALKNACTENDAFRKDLMACHQDHENTETPTPSGHHASITTDSPAAIPPQQNPDPTPTREDEIKQLQAQLEKLNALLNHATNIATYMSGDVGRKVAMMRIPALRVRTEGNESTPSANATGNTYPSPANANDNKYSNHKLIIQLEKIGLILGEVQNLKDEVNKARKLSKLKEDIEQIDRTFAESPSPAATASSPTLKTDEGNRLFSHISELREQLAQAQEDATRKGELEAKIRELEERLEQRDQELLAQARQNTQSLQDLLSDIRNLRGQANEDATREENELDETVFGNLFSQDSDTPDSQDNDNSNENETSDLTKELMAAAATADELRRQINGLRVELEQRDLELQQLRAQIANLNAEKAEFEQSLNKILDDHTPDPGTPAAEVGGDATTGKRSTTSDTDPSQAPQEQDRIASRLTKLLQDYKGKIARLEHDLEEAEAANQDNEQNRKRIENLQKELEQTQEDYNKLRQDLISLAKANPQQGATPAGATASTGTEQQNEVTDDTLIENIKKRLQELEAQLKEANAKAKKLEQKNGELNQQLQHAGSSINIFSAPPTTDTTPKKNSDGTGALAGFMLGSTRPRTGDSGSSDTPPAAAEVIPLVVQTAGTGGSQPEPNSPEPSPKTAPAATKNIPPVTQTAGTGGSESEPDTPEPSPADTPPSPPTATVDADELQRQIDKLRDELRKANAKAKKLEQKNGELNQQWRELINQLSSIGTCPTPNQNPSGSSSINPPAAAGAASVVIAATVAALRQQISQLRDELQNLNQQINDKKQELKNINDQLANARNAEAESQKKIKQAEAESQGKIERAEAELQKQKQQLDELTGKLQKLTYQLSFAQQIYDNKLQQLNDQLAESQNRIEQSEADSQNRIDQAESESQKRIKQAESEAERQKQQLDDRENTLKEWERRLKNTSHSSAPSPAAAEPKKADASTPDDKGVAQLQAQLDEARRQIDQLRTEKTQAEARAEDAKARAEDAEERAEGLQNDNYLLIAAISELLLPLWNLKHALSKSPLKNIPLLGYLSKVLEPLTLPPAMTPDGSSTPTFAEADVAPEHQTVATTAHKVTTEGFAPTRRPTDGGPTTPDGPMVGAKPPILKDPLTVSNMAKGGLSTLTELITSITSTPAATSPTVTIPPAMATTEHPSIRLTRDQATAAMVLALAAATLVMHKFNFAAVLAQMAAGTMPAVSILGGK